MFVPVRSQDMDFRHHMSLFLCLVIYKMGDHSSFSWYWWNCWPSLCNISSLKGLVCNPPKYTKGVVDGVGGHSYSNVLWKQKYNLLCDLIMYTAVDIWGVGCNIYFKEHYLLPFINGSPFFISIVYLLGFVWPLWK